MMSLKLAFEVAHVAQRKTKPAKGGFTHDWELSVRSPNKDGDLSLFVEKVIYNLHETFVKPKRSVKEPPYLIKESGYAAFEVLIEIYLRNRDEPRKFTFTYDLDLQPSKSEIKEFTIDNPTDDFRRKCLKGGCQLVSGGGGGGGSSSTVEYKKPKRPDDNKTNKIFTDLFGAPLEKPKNSSGEKIPHALPPMPSASSSSSSGKDKGEKSSKHKHAVGEGKDSKKSSESSRSGDKVKKDKTKDRDRGSDKKEKSSKRAPSPSPSRATGNIQTLQNQSLPAYAAPSTSSKPDYPKPTHITKPQTPIPEIQSNKKSSKKKNYEKDHDKSERKEKSDTSSAKTKERTIKNEERQQKQAMMPAETSKALPPPESSKKYESKEPDRKHNKHNKNKKSKESKESKEKDRKESKVKPQPLPVKPKSHVSDMSDSDSVSTKQEENIREITPQKNITPDKAHKGSKASSRVEKPVKVPTEKEVDPKKRKKKARESSPSPSPIPPKIAKRDYSPIEKPTTDTNTSLNNAGNIKVTNEYLDELKDLKQKINTLQTKDLHQVVRLIASTGHYEITKSSFDFDLIKLDKTTVKRLQEFLATS